MQPLKTPYSTAGHQSLCFLFFFHKWMHSSLYHSYRGLYCFMMSAVKDQSCFYLSFFHWSLKGSGGVSLESTALILWISVVVSPGNHYTILSVISWVVTDTVCACSGSIRAVLLNDIWSHCPCFLVFVPTLLANRWDLIAGNMMVIFHILYN